MHTPSIYVPPYYIWKRLIKLVDTKFYLWYAGHYFNQELACLAVWDTTNVTFMCNASNCLNMH